MHRKKIGHEFIPRFQQLSILRPWASWSSFRSTLTHKLPKGTEESCLVMAGQALLALQLIQFQVHGAVHCFQLVSFRVIIKTWHCLTVLTMLESSHNSCPCEHDVFVCWAFNEFQRTSIPLGINFVSYHFDLTIWQLKVILLVLCAQLLPNAWKSYELSSDLKCIQFSISRKKQCFLLFSWFWLHFFEDIADKNLDSEHLCSWFHACIERSSKHQNCFFVARKDDNIHHYQY